ncbi:MAG: family 20 glycosylhydrolase, partial [Negativicutes bacterium]|nr:family 20 glycosylhydrolase [Negativicutes bacterium]
PVLISADEFSPDDAVKGDVHLRLCENEADLGEEGYKLEITPGSLFLSANRPAGLFHGVQTIRQLLPAAIESHELQYCPWEIAAMTIWDQPRFAWRGAMLDVARHFFCVADVKRYIDEIAYYKMNRFHLHLSDDQGWRLMIATWPRLSAYGGSTAVGNDPGGFYTQAEYAEIVAYAQSRYITVVPEIDMPGHTNAALASYPELNCDSKAPALHTGIEVGISSLCTDKEVTYRFVEDVVREVAALTPGPYFHIGGDEASVMTSEDYRRFVTRVLAIADSYGKKVVGWEEIAQVDLQPSTLVQVWKGEHGREAIAQGCKLILSPGSKTYLDMMYDASSPLGLKWAGYVEVRDAYDWDPLAQLEWLSEEDVAGVEAPLWSETLRTMGDIEFMAFPRLPGIAEIGWSPMDGRNWGEYRHRLGTHGARLAGMGIHFYRSPQVDWDE